MPIATQMQAVSGDSSIWRPLIRRSAYLEPTTGTEHSYTTDSRAFAEADWVYLQAVTYAEQIHPATLEDLDKLGVRDLERWSIEGPTSLRPGESGNCTLKLEASYSMTASAGSDWREFRPGRYKLRSYKLRITVTRPSTSYNFRIYRLAYRAQRIASPMRDHMVERFFDAG